MHAPGIVPELDEELLEEEDELEDKLMLPVEELLEELDEDELKILEVQYAVCGIKSPVISFKHPCSPKKQTGVRLLLHLAI